MGPRLSQATREMALDISVDPTKHGFCEIAKAGIIIVGGYRAIIRLYRASPMFRFKNIKKRSNGLKHMFRKYIGSKILILTV